MQAITEEIAAELLDTDGMAAIWKLHLIAADAYRGGHDRAAEALIKIADAAAEIIRRRAVTGAD
jgi:hypothetical protein